jgi:di/tricarboxylate transporter
MVGTAVLSAFISNTGTVAMMIPVVVAAAWGLKSVPSKFLLPVAIAANIAGALTLISTSTNIIVSDTLVAAGHRPFGFFEFTLIGLPLVAFTILYVLFFGKRLLPEYQPKKRPVDLESSLEDISETYSLEGNIFWLNVLLGSDLSGQTLRQANIGMDFGITVLHIEAHQPEIERGDRALHIRSVLQRLRQPEDAAKKRSLFARLFRTTYKSALPPALPSPDTRLEIGDMLLVKGEPAAVQRLTVQHNLGIEPIAEMESGVIDRLLTRELGFAEVVIPPRSKLEDRTVIEAKFAERFDLQVISVTRQNQIVDLQGEALEVGDTLLIRGTWAAIGKLRDAPENFVVVGQPEAVSEQIVGLGRQAYLALGILAGMVVLMLTGVVPTVMAALMAAVAMVLLGVITMPQAYRSINWNVVVLIAALIPMGVALEKTGGVDFMADTLVNTVGQLGPLVLMAGIFLLASGFSQVISNVAATILISPVAYQAAVAMEVSPYPFMMMVAVGVVTGIMTPIAGAPMLIVMNPGQYEFKDYAKVGFPLLILIFIISLILVPIIWPL